MVTFSLTPEQARLVRAGEIEVNLTPRQALSIRAAVNSASGGGRPKVLHPCKHCGREFGTREVREHQPVCPEKP